MPTGPPGAWDGPAGPSSTPTRRTATARTRPGTRSATPRVPRSRASAPRLARLLSGFAARQRVTGATTPAVRLVRLDEPWRLGEALADPGAARARRELLPCPVVAYGTGPGAWVVFAVPRSVDLPAWRVGARDLLVDLGPAVTASHPGAARPVHRDG